MNKCILLILALFLGSCSENVVQPPDPYTISIHNRLSGPIHLIVDSQWKMAIPAQTIKITSVPGGIHILEYVGSSYYDVDTIAGRYLRTIP